MKMTPRLLSVLSVTLYLVLSAVPVKADYTFSFQPYALPNEGRVVVPVAQGEKLTGVASDLDQITNGALSIAATEQAFIGEPGSSVTLLGIKPFSRIDLIGVGDEPLDQVDAENFGSAAATLLADSKNGSVQILWPDSFATQQGTAARVAFGFSLNAYRFDRYRADKRDAQQLPAIQLLSNDESEDEFDNHLSRLAKAVYFARDMSSEPANIIYPQTFVERVNTLFKDVEGVRIKVLDEKQIQKRGMGAHWAVGKGSKRPPRLLIIEYMGGGDEEPIVLAGKGITFDTGGISLKRNKDMWMMKGDLGGASVVVGTVFSAASRGEKVNVVAIAALAENMPSGMATRPGDVLTTMSGKTVEISSTDAEGRLVLADAVFFAQQEYKPSVLINVATLTGSVYRALGDEYAGIFGRHQALIDTLSEASERAGEGVWHLPLDESHFKQIESKYADIINSGVGSPGASVGAAFIGSFVDPEQNWAHFDIASVDYYKEAKPTVPMGYSGWGVRTLDEYLRGVAIGTTTVSDPASDKE